jgi:hypothetical protein
MNGGTGSSFTAMSTGGTFAGSATFATLKIATGGTGGTRLLMGTLSSVEASVPSDSDSSNGGLGLRRLAGRRAARAWVRAMVNVGSDKLNKYRQKNKNTRTSSRCKSMSILEAAIFCLAQKPPLTPQVYSLPGSDLATRQSTVVRIYSVLRVSGPTGYPPGDILMEMNRTLVSTTSL